MANKKIDIDYTKLQSEIQSLDQLAGNTTVKDKIAEINRTINKSGGEAADSLKEFNEALTIFDQSITDIINETKNALQTVQTKFKNKEAIINKQINNLSIK